MTIRAKLALLGALVLTSLVGPQVWKRIPPFEQGVHEQDVRAAISPGKSDAPHFGDCPAFPPDNVWNTPIDHMPVDTHSSAFINSIGSASKLHPDFGSNLLSGIPYSYIPPGTKPVPVSFRYSDDSDLANYPIPPDAPVEGGPGSDSDRHVLLVDTQRCLLYELFAANAKPDGSWTAGSGVKIDLTSNALRPDGKTSADAAGLFILPALVRYEEVQAGAINHALRFSVPRTRSAYIWPARHSASGDADPNLPPLGMRFRLRADFDISGYSKTNQIILTALKRYGMILADNGGGIFISGVSDKRWSDDDLHKLTQVKGTDFEAVNESDFRMLANSARVDPLSVKR